ncbi:MAG: hypothetical protein KF749_12870 [Bacteroidetes bacterium]|nr:hypothetical protein [Bacteroidota bacterium]MCW5894412.1 hypothetical protein [Bacteroidota bacterium]
MRPNRSLIVVALFGASVVAAQQENIIFQQLSTADGLSRGTIYSILQDKQGFLWLGTATGLLRYDGYTFKRYAHNPSDSTSLSGDFIWSVCEDSSGDVWVGTSGRGLNRYVRAADRFVRYTSMPGDSTSLLGNEVVWVYVDRRNDVWAASWNGGLNKFNRSTETFTRYTAADGLPSSNVHRIYEDSDGRFWVGTRRGLARFDRESGSSRVYKPEPENTHSLSGEYIFAIYEMHDGSVWFGTDAGICQYSSTTDDFTRVRIPHLRNPVSALSGDMSGNLWVATDGDGLVRLNTRTGEQARFVPDPQDPNALSSHTVLSLHRDRTGILWLGTVATGLSKVDPHRKKFHHLSMNAATVNAIHEDSRGNLWIATQSGMHHVNRDGSRLDHVPRPLRKGALYSVCEDGEGNIWFGHLESGLHRLDTKGVVKNLGLPPGPQDVTNRFITSLFVDSHGYLWIGQSGGGVSRFDAKANTYRHHSMTTDPPLPASYIWAIHEDRRGYFWLGTWGAGVIRFNPATNESVVLNRASPRAGGKAISGNIVVAIAEEPDGTMWFGTWGDGLNRYDPVGDSITYYSTSNGLPNNHIYGILLDDKTGELWLTTGYGLARFNPKSGSCIAYDEGDGIQSLEFRRGAVHKGRSGMFYVGGVNGLNIFRPEHIAVNTHVPPVVLTSVRVLDNERNILHPSLALSYDEDFLAFEFAALDFVEPGKNRYAYRLEGLERDWVESGTRRYVSYANLSPGDYVFRVKGSNNDGVWNEEGTSFAFTIAPPPWQTWWAYCLYGIVLALSGVGFRRYEINKIKARERHEAAMREAELRAELEKQKTRVQIARDLHDEVGSTLSSISFFAQAMEQGEEKENAGKFLSLISESSAHAREAMSDIIWSIDPANDSWNTVISKLQRHASELFESKGIAHNIEMPSSEIEVVIDPQRRRHFWLLFKEIVTNAVKHSQCSEARIRLEVKGGRVSLSISDNGVGFDASSAKDGHGLKNIRSRGEVLGAVMNLTTSPGTGTDWRISFDV